MIKLFKRKSKKKPLYCSRCGGLLKSTPKPSEDPRATSSKNKIYRQFYKCIKCGRRKK